MRLCRPTGPEYTGSPGECEPGRGTGPRQAPTNLHSIPQRGSPGLKPLSSYVKGKFYTCLVTNLNPTCVLVRKAKLQYK